MGWRPEGDGGTGHAPGSHPSGRAHDVAGFAVGEPWDSCPPSSALAAALEAAAGGGWRCPGASRDEMLGVLRQWQALESWAAAGKLGVLRALIRADDQPLPGGGYRGDLPEGWTKSLTHEVALALSMPAVSADRLMWFAWDLAARFPGVGELLANGDLTCAKARAVCEPLHLLSDEDAARAEAMIVPELPGLTYGQAQKLAVQASVTVDPESATRRRQEAERSRSRVQMFREESGAAALSGRDMPTDETLAAHASVCARATTYQQSGLFPDDTRMDQFRVMAYLDLLNGVSADARLARASRPALGESDGPVPASARQAPDTGRDDHGRTAPARTTPARTTTARPGQILLRPVPSAPSPVPPARPASRLPPATRSGASASSGRPDCAAGDFARPGRAAGRGPWPRAA